LQAAIESGKESPPQLGMVPWVLVVRIAVKILLAAL
jgi:hypothetical protein